MRPANQDSIAPRRAPADAARREATEELGLVVHIERLLAVSTYRGNEQHYYLASVVGGTFGTGHGEEMRPDAIQASGGYTAVWLGREELLRRDVRPKSLATLLHAGAEATLTMALHIDD